MFLAIAGVLLFAAPALAGLLQNKDSVPYDYQVFWDDMEAPLKGIIEPGQEVELRESPCTIALPKRNDSMYMRPGETVFIRKGILRRPEDKK
ncbi:hypothetical protein [Oceanidesulfovibrio marinus]|uniref:Uncharacterized protein n=1 Tax=Oceanidesulfovibrio marinus TaxID=370038 RepID=A0A6P1ZFF4_9BACT|nr:hypothetical protein [Oceanidesulfovibrio marinus]QJT08391.1 hypothetical protein E8L03_05385 [Oceanidesulfovibrio marinus]TVM33138.1 hypothetical protein DQK91_13355 [Oceanidesulfovibrio marinus]